MLNNDLQPALRDADVAAVDAGVAWTFHQQPSECGGAGRGTAVGVALVAAGETMAATLR